MSGRSTPRVFEKLLFDNCIKKSDVLKTADGFHVVFKSVSNVLFEKGILDFPDSSGERLFCNKFFDDWFLFAVPNEGDYTYGLLKLREQENDAQNGAPADGDTPGVTISFIDFESNFLLDCIEDPKDDNRRKLNSEINRVVALKGQRHHKALKRYFKNPQSEGSYLVAEIYAKQVASFAEDGVLTVSECYKGIVQKSNSYKNFTKFSRLPRFIEQLNALAGYVICDNEKIFIKNKDNPTECEALAILATHTGNTSVHSFAAEVEYHARFLTPFAKLKIPFFGRSIYDSAIRADMSVDDTEFEGPAPFYNSNSKIVKRQRELHKVWF